MPGIGNIIGIPFRQGALLNQKPSTDLWDYEGILTVTIDYGYAGYFREGGVQWGSINPSPAIVSGFDETKYICYIINQGRIYVASQSYTKSANIISIDGVEYEIDDFGKVVLSPNPFSVVGAQHSIKLR